MKRIAILLFLFALLPLSAFAQSYTSLLTGGAAGDPDGTGLAVITLDGTTLRYTIWTQNIAAPGGAHIENAAGEVVVTLDPNALTNGSTTVSADVVNRIRSNPFGYAVELHNAEFPNGALRGQLSSGASGEGTMTSFIPVVGRVRGQGDTNFITDLRIVNNGSTTAHVKLEYFAQSGSGQTAANATQNVTVLPGEQRVLNDVVFTSLGVDAGLGGLRITSDQNVVASARVINDLRAQGRGTAGFAVDADDAADTQGTITFLSQSTDYRTNIGYFNPSGTPVSATFNARRSSDGAILGTNTVTIPGWSMVQQGAFALISSVPEAERTQDDFYVTWTASAPLFVYGAVTDNRTGDAVLNQ